MWPAIRVSAIHPNTGAPLHDVRVISVRQKPNLHLESYLQGVTGGMLSLWKLPVGVLEEFSGGAYNCEEN